MNLLACKTIGLLICLHAISMGVLAQDVALSIEESNQADQVSLTVASVEGSRWTIQSSNDLSAWTNLQNAEQLVVGANGSITVDSVNVQATPVFFRAIEDDGIPALFDLFNDNMEIYRDGDYVVIESSNLPDHPSPYFSIDNSQYEAYNGSNGSYRKNPNSIEEQAFVYRIPVNPREAANKSNTNLGSIGISVNGVAFFNQYAGPNNQPLTFEVNSFDQYNGHPQNTGVYHYHFEPIYLSSKYGKGAFLGVLLDGFPVYGPEENGVTLTSANLDDYHGHFGPTPEYPEGIYHYHFTEDGPYLNGGQFFGTPGTQTN